MRLAAFLLVFGALAPAFAQAPEAEAPAAAQVVAGKVELVEGDVRFLAPARGPRSPKVDDAVYEGDSIVTGSSGEVHLRMEDGGLIAVRPNTRMRIANFRAEGDDDDRLAIGLLAGSFRSITGWIAKFSRNNYTVRTPTATIGVRGTDHEPFVIPEGSALGEPGTYDKVNQGGTFIASRHGRVEIAPNQSGFAHARRAERPQVLARVPAHFRATRNEERVTRRYQEIQQRVQQQREERRKVIQERKVKPAPATKVQGQADKSRRDERSKALEERKHERDKAHKDREARKAGSAAKHHSEKEHNQK